MAVKNSPSLGFSRNWITAISNVAVHDLTIRHSKFKMAVKSSREEQVIH